MKLSSFFKRVGSAVIAAGLCSTLVANAAVITFTTDEADDLKGTFVASGRFDSASAAPAQFGLLPGIGGSLFVYKDLAVIDPAGFGFYTSNQGLPGDPLFFAKSDANPQAFAPLGGTYTNSGQELEGGTPVFWLFSGFHDEGGNGAFSGSFCFSTRQDGCAEVSIPEPGTLALLGFGLAGLAVSRRRKR